MKDTFAMASLTGGQLNSMVKKLGGPQNVLRFLRGEIKVITPWEEKDGVIYLTVTSDGTVGPDWIDRLNRNGVDTSGSTQELLCSSEFKSTKGVTYRVAVCRHTLVSSEECSIKELVAKARQRGFRQATPEIGCLIQEYYMDQMIAMDIRRILVMHKPVNDLRFGVDAGGTNCVAAAQHVRDFYRCGEGGYAFLDQKN